MRQTILYSIQAALAVLGLYLVVFFISKKEVVSIWLYAVSFLPVLYFQVQATQAAPTSDKEVVRTWIKHPFLVFLISSAAYYILYVSLLHLSTEMMQWWFEARDAIARKILGQDVEIPDERVMISLKQWLFRFIFGLVGGFILSALIVQYKRSRN